jgi:hypothetical protein
MNKSFWSLYKKFHLQKCVWINKVAFNRPDIRPFLVSGIWPDIPQSNPVSFQSLFLPLLLFALIFRFNFAFFTNSFSFSHVNYLFAIMRKRCETNPFFHYFAILLPLFLPFFLFASSVGGHPRHKKGGEGQPVFSLRYTREVQTQYQKNSTTCQILRKKYFISNSCILISEDKSTLYFC